MSGEVSGACGQRQCDLVGGCSDLGALGQPAWKNGSQTWVGIWFWLSKQRDGSGLV